MNTTQRCIVCIYLINISVKELNIKVLLNVVIMNFLGHIYALQCYYKECSAFL